MDNTLKTVFAVGFVIAVIGALFVVADTLRDIRASIPTERIIVTEAPLGGVADQINFSNTTSATTTCLSFDASGTTAMFVGTTTNRTSFSFQNKSSSSVNLCRGSTCGGTAHEGGASKGILLAPTSTLVKSYYEQTDGYIGPYACTGVGAVSTTQVYYEQGTGS